MPTMPKPPIVVYATLTGPTRLAGTSQNPLDHRCAAQGVEVGKADGVTETVGEKDEMAEGESGQGTGRESH
jgi:hypothetical protein